MISGLKGSGVKDLTQYLMDQAGIISFFLLNVQIIVIYSAFSELQERHCMTKLFSV